MRLTHAFPVNIESLSAQQLTAVKKQLDEEVEHLTASYTQLAAAQAKFKECLRIVQTGSSSFDGMCPPCLPVASSLVHFVWFGFGHLGALVMGGMGWDGMEWVKARGLENEIANLRNGKGGLRWGYDKLYSTVILFFGFHLTLIAKFIENPYPPSGTNDYIPPFSHLLISWYYHHLLFTFHSPTAPFHHIQYLHLCPISYFRYPLPSSPLVTQDKCLPF